MTRYNFAREGVISFDRIIDPGALVWDEGRVLSVTWNFDFTNPNHIMGEATDIRRDDEGWFSAEIAWLPKNQAIVNSDLGKSFFLTFFGNEVERYAGREDKLEHISNCRIRSIVAIIGPDPWQEIISEGSTMETPGG